jgi:hypothetical protein
MIYRELSANHQSDILEHKEHKEGHKGHRDMTFTGHSAQSVDKEKPNLGGIACQHLTFVSFVPLFVSFVLKNMSLYVSQRRTA